MTTQDCGEIHALLKAIKQAPKTTGLHLEIGSKQILKSLTIDLPRLETTGWIGVENSEPLRAIIAELREEGQKLP